MDGGKYLYRMSSIKLSRLEDSFRDDNYIPPWSKKLRVSILYPKMKFVKKNCHKVLKYKSPTTIKELHIVGWLNTSLYYNDVVGRPQLSQVLSLAFCEQNVYKMLGSSPVPKHNLHYYNRDRCWVNPLCVYTNDDEFNKNFKIGRQLQEWSLFTTLPPNPQRPGCQ